MAAGKPTLILVHEPEKACFDRLLADGFAPRAAMEISSYLAQSTDLAPEFGAIAEACVARGLDFRPSRSMMRRRCWLNATAKIASSGR